MLARTLFPAWGFVAYGVLYFVFFGSFALLAAGGLMALILSSAFGFGANKPIPPLGEAAVWMSALCGVAASVWPFRYWARSKRAPAQRLFEMGTFVEGVVEAVSTVYLRRAPMRTTERLVFQRGAENL